MSDPERLKRPWAIEGSVELALLDIVWVWKSLHAVRRLAFVQLEYESITIVLRASASGETLLLQRWQGACGTYLRQLPLSSPLTLATIPFSEAQ